MKLQNPYLVLLLFSSFACGDVPASSELLASPTLDAALPSDCMALHSCCPTLPSEVVTSCESLSAQASATECAREVSALQASSHCLTSVSSAKDASIDAPASTSVDAGAVACTLLRACCTSSALPNDQAATCSAALGAGDESECSTVLADLTGSQECGVAPSGGGCPALMACCGNAALPTSDTATCDETVSIGDDTECTELFDALAGAGYCGAGVTLPDGGHLLTAGCMTLSMCCGEITFPEGTLSTCQTIAKANNDATCVSAYDGYAALSYCE